MSRKSAKTSLLAHESAMPARRRRQVGGRMERRRRVQTRAQETAPYKAPKLADARPYMCGASERRVKF